MKNGTKCPLIKDYCYGSICALWNYTRKYNPETKTYDLDKGYCLVRDFLMTLTQKASE